MKRIYYILHLNVVSRCVVCLTRRSLDKFLLKKSYGLVKIQGFCVVLFSIKKKYEKSQVTIVRS